LLTDTPTTPEKDTLTCRLSDASPLLAWPDRPRTIWLAIKRAEYVPRGVFRLLHTD